VSASGGAAGVHAVRLLLLLRGGLPVLGVLLIHVLMHMLLLLLLLLVIGRLSLILRLLLLLERGCGVMSGGCVPLEAVGRQVRGVHRRRRRAREVGLDAVHDAQARTRPRRGGRRRRVVAAAAAAAAGIATEAGRQVPQLGARRAII